MERAALVALSLSNTKAMRRYLIGLLLVLMMSACTKELQIQPAVQIVQQDIDPDGLITACWRYPDGRIGGTDWTEPHWLSIMINEQRSWPKCISCDRVTQQVECWRHKP